MGGQQDDLQVDVGRNGVQGFVPPQELVNTQQVIALSSGEAELYAQIKGAAQTLGLISMAADFGECLQGTVYSDSVASLGICTRVGLGKVRHIKISSCRRGSPRVIWP